MIVSVYASDSIVESNDTLVDEVYSRGEERVLAEQCITDGCKTMQVQKMDSSVRIIENLVQSRGINSTSQNIMVHQKGYTQVGPFVSQIDNESFSPSNRSWTYTPPSTWVPIKDLPIYEIVGVQYFSHFVYMYER